MKVEELIALTRVQQSCCPACGAATVEWEELEQDPLSSMHGSTINGWCHTCGVEWTETLKVTEVEVW